MPEYLGVEASFPLRCHIERVKKTMASSEGGERIALDILGMNSLNKLTTQENLAVLCPFNKLKALTGGVF